MPTGVTLQLPDGALEYRLTEREIQIGDELRRNGETWVVTEVRPEEDGTTTIGVRPKPVPGSDGSP